MTCLRQVGAWVTVDLGTIIGLSVVPAVWAGLFTALESFMPGHGAQLIQQACDPAQQAGRMSRFCHLCLLSTAMRPDNLEGISVYG